MKTQKFTTANYFIRTLPVHLPQSFLALAGFQEQFSLDSAIILIIKIDDQMIMISCCTKTNYSSWKDKIQIESDVHLAEFKVMDLDDINVGQLQAGKRGVKLFQNPFLSFCCLVFVLIKWPTS